MPTINPNENLIRIYPPIPWPEIHAGPALSALGMRFDTPPGADLSDPDAPFLTVGATGISASSFARTDSDLDRELQKVIDHYAGHTFRGHIEVRYDRPQGAVAVRGRTLR
jgi:hypothetical protein